MIRLGFTLIEMLLVVALLGVLLAIALPAYSGYVDRARVGQAIGDIKKIELLIERFNTVNFRLPASLGEIGEAVPTDPWGAPYIYLNITTAKGKGEVRKDKKLNPINFDYDLYSVGKDGKTKKQLDNKDSLDDVVRANNGGYVGLAEDY